MQTERYQVKFTNRSMTAYGGAVLLKNFMDSIGLKEAIASWDLPQQYSNRGYQPKQLLKQMIAAIWLGAGNYSQLDLSRFDPVIRRIFGWDKVAEHKAVQRYLNKFTQASCQSYMRKSYGWFFSRLPKRPVTLELDSTVITRHGQQIQGAKAGYNPRYKGRNSHHPLVAFIGSMRMVANFWLRPGNTGTANNVLSFMEETLGHLKGIPVGLVRADSGFWSHELIELLRRRQIPYIISAKLTARLQKEMIKQCCHWKVIDKGIEISELVYESVSFGYSQRIVVVRQHINRRQASGRSLNLFSEDAFTGDWRYSAFSTDLSFEDVVIWDMYRGRANCENQIKELKSDFGLNRFVLRDFWATEAGLTTGMLSYNLMSLFRQLVLRLKHEPTLSTIQRLCLNIAGIWQEPVFGKAVFRLALPKKRQKWFGTLWDASLDPPIP